ncbi:hypothetical protein V3481_006651 [Fusarium oxysporum f. sp. vasinfectum]|uniref:NmrA-like domain-containing protein n=1 Tax=Fusarium oxysporum f. sp. vasinfectum 25433 TaxID=1089449 RepID=X0L434_FUSOX|nr:hypothetical protein FOTG_15879 [Fusarium oxysporum f. sp. vasinfectum 25433]
MTTKIIAVVGATGNQGSSVVETFLGEPGWTVRGITRDPSKTSSRAWANRGVDIVAGDLDVPGSMEKAFRGANVVFGTTDFVQHLQDPKIIASARAQNRPINELATERELEQAKRLVDAAAANVDALDRFVLSTLSDTKGLSQNKIRYNLHFDCKWGAVEYLKDKYPKLWDKTSLLQLGIFASNWKVPYYTPRKQVDGTFKISLPMSGEKEFPIIDPNADTGCMAKALVQVAPGTHLVGASSMISWNEWCKVWSSQTEVQCTFERLDRKVFEDTMGPLGREIADMFQASKYLIVQCLL